jgi:hypothetical protein
MSYSLLAKGASSATAGARTAEFVRFWHAETRAEGLFCCVACGRRVVSVDRLPPCSGCDGRLWEGPESSPFAYPDPDIAYERWHEHDLDSAARTVRGLRLAVGLGAATWVLLVVLFYGVTHV